MSRILPPPRPSLAPPSAPPRVRTDGGRRSLEFVPGDVQSAMLVADPVRLVLAYTRAMACFALFVPRPRHIVMVGLGGGSLAKYCYRHFPDARISVIELRADVIALREQFCIPPDDYRFEVVQADATTWLAGMAGSADVLLLDGFDERGLPPELGSARFYADCRRALAEGGVMVANIFSYDPGYRAMLARLRLIFLDRVCRLDRVAGNNHIVFAVKTAARATRSLRMQRWLARHNGLGRGWLNRALVSAVLAWTAHRPH